MTPITRPRRSALYLPASNARAIEKAKTLPADIIILDLEDAVSPNAKSDARNAAVQAVKQGGFGTREVAIRVNGLDTPWGFDDLNAVIHSNADAILVPKVSTADDIHAYNAHLEGAPKTMQLWAMLETCRSMANLDAIAATAHNSRLSLFIVGTNDLAKEMRAQLTKERTAFLPYLAMSVAAARSYGISILDGVCNEFRDLELFQQEAQQGRTFGFEGKSLIHPAQISPCNATFSPSEEALLNAQRLIDTFSLPENAGKGAINFEGGMAELLHLEEAHQLIALQKRIDQAAL